MTGQAVSQLQPVNAKPGGSAVSLNARASADFDAKAARARALLVQAAAEFAPVTAGAAALITQASSLGAEDMVVSHLIRSLGLGIEIFVLDTGMLHDETITLLKQLKDNSPSPLQVYTPSHESVVKFVKREGKDPMYRSIALRKACCDIRKMEPLARALTGKKAWITGLRREQSDARADVPLRDESDARRVKFNPLSEWTWGDVWYYIGLHNIAYNPLHDQFYPSIGCAPCTRAISQGEDFRAGRWWWEDETAKECGLHAAQGELHAVQGGLQANGALPLKLKPAEEAAA